jgi:UDP-N-acetylglucosamine 4,6-dehydratase
MLSGKILITGGAGYLGKAIIKRATEEKWNADITIFSTDAVKHMKIVNEYPHVHSVIGDIRDGDTLWNAMTGKDLVIHAAAVKHIDVSEYNSIDTIDINVTGSLNVLRCAAQLGIPKVIGISTDKACHPANTYGASKYAMEKMFQEFSRLGLQTTFHLVRYGNVLDSTASVLTSWKKAVAEGKPIKITDPEMTRFWLSPSQAVDHIIEALKLESGHIYVPLLPALSISKLAEYTVGLGVAMEHIEVRPGEKKRETLLTKEEGSGYAVYKNDINYDLSPTTSIRLPRRADPYTSDISIIQLTREELMALLEE